MTIFLHAAFHALAGSLFGLGALLLSPNDYSTARFVAAAFAYVIAWLAGFLVPGSPAGLGVREVVLLYLLSGHYPESTLLILILASRIVTTFGDVLFYLAALALPNGERT